MARVTLTIHPAQTAKLLELKSEQDAAAQRFTDAVSMVVLGQGISDGVVENLDTDTHVLTVTVPDPPA